MTETQRWWLFMLVTTGIIVAVGLKIVDPAALVGIATYLMASPIKAE